MTPSEPHELGQLRAELKVTREEHESWRDKALARIDGLNRELAAARAGRRPMLTPAQRLVLATILLAFCGLFFYLGQQVQP